MAGLHNPNPSVGGHTVDQAVHWNDASGSEYCFVPALSGISGTGNAEDLGDVGWTVTSLAFAQGSGGDFLSSADIDPVRFTTNAALDKLESPQVFGDIAHSLHAQHHLGFAPTTLDFEGWAQFSITSANETATGLGFFIGGGSIVTAADAIAVIHTDGTNFTCRSNADSDVGATDDEALHLFRIVISTGSATNAVEWFIDGTSQGTLDRRSDAYPCGLGWGNVTGGANRIQIGAAKVIYR